MPYISGPGCPANSCDSGAFPVTAATCICTPALGGIAELYFIPCDETMSEANVADIDWWSTLVTDSKLGRTGPGLGSIAAGNKTTQRTSSCLPETTQSATWNLTWQFICVDKTSARTTEAKLNEMLNNFKKYLLLARMCDGDDEVLPIGKFTASDFDWTVPDNNEAVRIAQIVLSWKQLSFPQTVDVAGLSAVVSKP